MAQEFTDHFAPVAGQYAAFRPHYPAALFEWLAAIAPAHELAWDCATGSGQAAVDLAAHFRHVHATDASAAQIADAQPDPAISYHVAPAERSGLADGCADLVTVAQALHWFDLAPFYREVRRVLKPRGVLAVWTYGVQHLDEAALDVLIQHFYHDTVGPFWPPERVHVETAYRDLPFPFAELDVPSFVMQADWTLAQLLGYLGSWSATARYRKQHGRDPLALLAPRLAALWGEPQQRRRVHWPLSVRAGVPVAI